MKTQKRWGLPLLIACFSLLRFPAAAQEEGAVAPWQLYPVTLDTPLKVGLEHELFTVDSIAFSQAEEESFVGEVTVRVGESKLGLARLVVVLFDAERSPLMAGTEVFDRPVARTVGNRHELIWRVRLALGDAKVAAQAKFFAVALISPGVTGNNLVAAANGGQVVKASSTYGGSYDAASLIDGNPRTVWCSRGGGVQNEWFIFAFPGGATATMGAVGINPAAESSYRDCALKDFRLLVSETGMEEADFKEVFVGTCAYTNDLQRFAFDPVEARYVKLVCVSNQGNNQWIEMTELEVYPAEKKAEVVRPLAEIVEDFEQSSLLTEQEIAAQQRRSGYHQQPPTLPAPAWPVRCVHCQSATFAGERETQPGTVLTFGRLSYNFGDLLGGAPQWCSVMLNRLLSGQPRRIQLRARPEAPGNLLRSTVWDRNKEWFLFQFAEMDWRGWKTVGIDLDPAKAVMHGGEVVDNVIDYPVRLMQLSVNPTERDTLAGSVCIDDLIALSRPEE